MQNLDPNNYDISQIGIQFGEDFEGDGKTHLSLHLSLSSEEIKAQLDSLQASTKASASDLSHALVLEFPVEDAETQQILSQAFEEFFQAKKLPLKVLRNQPNAVVLVLKMSAEKEEALLQPLKFLLSQGLSALHKQSPSHFSINLSSAADFKDLQSFLADNESIVCTFLQSSKLQLKLAVAKNFVEELSKVFNKIDPQFNNSPPMVLLKAFTNIDVDLRFQSTLELPQNVRNILFYPKFLRSVSEETRKLQPKEPSFSTILEKIKSKVKGFVIVPELMVVKLDAELPNASIFVKEYLGILNYF